jgi:MFS family permease
MSDQAQNPGVSAAAPRPGPWLFAFVMLAAGAVSLAFAVNAPLLGPLAQRFGGEAAAQQIVVGPLLGFAVGGLVAGMITAALGARRTILASAAVFALSGSSGLWAQSAEVLLVNTFLLGISAVALATAGAVVLAERWEGDARARVIGYQTAFGSSLSSGGTFLSGVIADAAGWRAAYLLFVGLGVITFVVAAIGVGYVARVRREKGTRAALRDYLPVVPAYVAVAVTLLAVTTTFTHMSLMLAGIGVHSATVAAAVIAAQGGAAMVTAFCYGALVARIGRIATVTLGVVLSSAGLILSGLAPSIPVFVFGAAGMGAAVGVIFPFLTEEVLRLAPPAIRAQAFGFFQTAQFAGGFLNPFVVGPVTAAIGLHSMYVAVGVVSGVLGLGGLAVLAARARARLRLTA